MSSQVPNAPLEEFLAADDAARASILEAKDLHRVLEGLEATITTDATVPFHLFHVRVTQKNRVIFMCVHALAHPCT